MPLTPLEEAKKRKAALEAQIKSAQLSMEALDSEMERISPRPSLEELTQRPSLASVTAPPTDLPPIDQLVAPVEAETQLVQPAPGPRIIRPGRASRFAPPSMRPGLAAGPAGMPLSELQEQGGKGLGGAIKGGAAALSYSPYGGFGLAEAAGRRLAPELAAQFDSIPSYPLMEAVGGLYGSIQGIGALAQASRFTSRIAAQTIKKPWLLRLAGEAAGGKYSPRLSQFVHMAIGGSVANALAQNAAELAVPGEQDFDWVGVGLGGIEAGAAGAVSVPSGKAQLQKGVLELGRLSQGWRALAIGAPVTALYKATGRERTPFYELTGIPAVDSSIYDFGLQTLLSPKPGRVGNTIPVLTTVKGKPNKVMDATILSVDKTAEGGRAYTLRLENGLIRPYVVGGTGIQLDVPEPIKAPKAPGADPRIRNGSLVVYKAPKGEPRIGVFQYRGGETFEIGWLTQRGQKPSVYSAKPVKDIRYLRLVDSKEALDTLLPPGVKAEPAPQATDVDISELPSDSATRFTFHSRAATTLKANQLEGARQTVNDIISKLPEPYQGLVGEVRLDWLPEAEERGFYDYGTKRMTVNLAKFVDPRSGMIFPTERTGFKMTGIQNLTKTILHEYAHRMTEAGGQAKRQGLFRALGWLPVEEIGTPGAQLIVDTVAPDPNGRGYDVLNSASYLGTLKSAEGLKRFAVADSLIEGTRWARPLTTEEEDAGSIYHERRSPDEDVAHGVDALLWNPDVMYVRERARWDALTQGLGERLREVSGFTQYAEPASREIGEPLPAQPTPERVQTAELLAERTPRPSMLKIHKSYLDVTRAIFGEGMATDIDPHNPQRAQPVSNDTYKRIRNLVSTRADLPIKVTKQSESFDPLTGRYMDTEGAHQYLVLYGFETTNPKTGEVTDQPILIDNETDALAALRLLRSPTPSADAVEALGAQLRKSLSSESLDSLIGERQLYPPGLRSRATDIPDDPEARLQAIIKAYNEKAKSLQDEITQRMSDPAEGKLVEKLYEQLEFVDTVFRQKGLDPDRVPIEGADMPAGLGIHLQAMKAALDSAKGKETSLSALVSTYKRRVQDRVTNLSNEIKAKQKEGLSSPLLEEEMAPTPRGDEGEPIETEVATEEGELTGELSFAGPEGDIETGEPTAPSKVDFAYQAKQEGERLQEAALLAGGAKAAPVSRRKPKGIIHKLFKTMAGVEGKREQFMQELASLTPQMRYAVMEFFGVDVEGRPVKAAKSLEDVARTLNMHPNELGMLFRGYIRRADGELYKLPSKTTTAPETRELPGGQRVFGFVSGEQFQAQYNLEQARLAGLKAIDDQRQKVHETATKLLKAPTDPTLQHNYRAALDRLARLENPDEVPDRAPGPDVQPAFEFPVAPPPAVVNEGLRKLGVKPLFSEWRKAAIRTKEAPEDKAALERLSEVVAEMRRRNLKVPDAPYPAKQRPGGSNKPPAQRHPGAPRKAPPAPSGSDTSKQGDYRIRLIDDLEAEGVDLALKKRDARPKIVIVEELETGEVIGTWRTHKVAPDFAANSRYGIKYFGYLDEAGRPTTDRKKGVHYYTITDFKTKEDIGNYSLGSIQKIIGKEFRPGIDYDPMSGTLNPTVAEVGEATQSTPAARIGTRSISRGEYANLIGQEQLAHTRGLIMAHSPEQAEAAWRTYKEFINVYGVKDYEGYANDVNALLNEMYTKYGRMPTGGAPSGLPHDIINKIKKDRDAALLAAVREFQDFYPKDLGGTGAAYDHKYTTENFLKLMNAAADPDHLPIDQRSLEEGFLTLGHNSYSPVVRQMLLWGHPMMADIYVKARGADAFHGQITRAWKQTYDKIVEGLTIPQKLAISLIMDGRYEASQAVRVSKRSFISNDAWFANLRKGIQTTWSILTGHPATKEVTVADATPELVQKAAQLRKLTNDIAEALGLDPNKMIEDYFPHVYKMRDKVIDFPLDMNVGRDVYFRFAQARRTTAPDYELNPDEVFDLYIRGASRRLAYTPLIEEVNNKRVRALLPKAQRDYVDRWLKYLVGEPDPADASVKKQLEALGIPSAPGATTSMLRRWIFSQDRPFTRMAAALRGWQFAAKIDYNFATGFVNMGQAWLTSIERHGLGAWMQAIKTYASDPELRAAYEASGLATEYARADMGTQLVSATRNYVRRFGRKLFTTAENINRTIAFTTGYKAAKEAGLDPVERSIAGILESDLTQFNMTRSGRIPWTRSGLGSVIFQFTPYRFEMLAHIGGEVKRLFVATQQRNKEQQYLAFKRLLRISIAAHMVGGLDAHLMGPLLRLWSDEDDPEFSGFWGALDAASLDYQLGMWTTNRPFEYGAKINPLNLMNRNLTGPLPNLAFDAIDWLRGAPMAPTAGHYIVSNLPGGVQLERTAGPEIEKYITKPLLGPKQGKLRTVQGAGAIPLAEELAQRAGGPKTRRGQKFSRG